MRFFETFLFTLTVSAAVAISGLDSGANCQETEAPSKPATEGPANQATSEAATNKAATNKAATSKAATESVEEQETTDPASKTVDENPPGSDEPRPDFNTGKLTFTFKNTEWGKVIRWFADQAKLDLNMAVVPEGSFSYSSNGEFTLLEAMDVINSFLIREQGYILIRHANLIIVHDLNVEIPPTMIETIPQEELENRGEYELTQTEFDISGIDADTFANEIENLVREDQGGQQLLVTSSEVLVVRETGGRLRLIRKYLEMARKVSDIKEGVIQIVELKYSTPEEIISVAQQIIPLDDEYSFENEESGEKLKVVVQTFGNKFILSGTSKTSKRFQDLVSMLDKESTVDNTEVELSKPVTKKYAVKADQELTLQVLRTLLAGTEGLRLALAEESGEIVAYGTPEVHTIITETLGSLESDASGFEVLRLNDYDADSMIEILNKMYGITEEAEATPNAPVFLADPIYSDQIIARAKPAQLQAIKTLVERIDPPIGASGKYDKNYLQLDYRGKQAEATIDLIKDMYQTMGRPNKIKVYKSDAVRNALERIERSEPAPSPDELQPFTNPSSDSSEKPTNKGGAFPSANDLRKSTINAPATSQIFVSTGMPVQTDEDEEKKTRRADQEVLMKQGEIETLPGAPILIRETNAGLFIISDDLEALAEIKEFLKDQEEILNRPSLPTIIELRHRKAIEMKDLLEMFLGISSDSGGGGGGGGMGGLLGGVAQNAIGGAAGEMIGGLLGGGGGMSSGGATASDLLTGDVKIDADALTNVLLVQANTSDLEVIMEYVNYFDTDSPEHDPTLDGRTYSIPVKYRDASELSEVIKTQLADRIKSPKQQSSGGNDNPQAAQMKMLQQLMGRGGRGGRGGGNSSVEQSEPKMMVGVDTQLNAILVTGPEFLYQQVRSIVDALDTKDAVSNGTVIVMGLKKLTPDAAKSFVDGMQAQQGQRGSTASAASNTSTTANAPGTPGFNPAQFFQNRMQSGAISGGNPFGGGRGMRGGGTTGRGGATQGRGGRGGGRGGR